MKSIQINRFARDKFQFAPENYLINGLYRIQDLSSARLFSLKIQTKKTATNESVSIQPSKIFALATLWDIQSKLIRQHILESDPSLVNEWMGSLKSIDNGSLLLDFLTRTLSVFPTKAMQFERKNVAEEAESVLTSIDQGTDFFIRYLLGYVNNQNAALASFKEIIGDQALQGVTSFGISLANTEALLEKRPRVGKSKSNLIDFLLEPARRFPNSLDDQLKFILKEWSAILPEIPIDLLLATDSISEESAPRFQGPGPVAAPGLYPEPADLVKFSADRDWMPNLVLIAKNTFVWLHQLSRAYGRQISTLDQVPDEELKRLADSGFTGLWLIGLWERSVASARIKQMCGNNEAIASAYSIHDYQIAASLGGQNALQNLKDRAESLGIRLASDMVPNHMGIDSTWVLDHPDWFISLDNSPFPSYRFDGADLSPRDSVGIYLEDHYYSKDDAAVVFKRLDKNNNSSRFIYHGNDGTSMPWNDTAQLNYLLPEVREAVIQTILRVARDFHIIRFDAAMTLAKKHYQRLWYPEPGTGGAIPSRAEHAMSKSQFNELFPEEFWREVVDRVGAEVPDTLLLAEAFWLMEGYFVRSLGMHRVYNSAFMNMLRDENNTDYRKIIKDTISFEPEILKRYVNFMNNPDERTAIEQFGSGDKYFGICILMCTLPGLPMFGHGQLEGFTEKYGMEFYKPQLEEPVNEQILARHQSQVFPILHQRYRYAGVENFRFYDFHSDRGTVNEHVYAFTNKAGNDPVLVVFNNKFERAHGRIDLSTKIKTHDHLTEETVASSLGITDSHAPFFVLHDSISGLDLLIKNDVCRDQGIELQLNGYQAIVFDRITAIYDDPESRYEEAYSSLNNTMRHDIIGSILNLKHAPIQNALVSLINPDYFGYLYRNQVTARRPNLSMKLLDEAGRKFGEAYHAISDDEPLSKNRESAISGFQLTIRNLLSLSSLAETSGAPQTGRSATLLKHLHELTREPEGFYKIFTITLAQELVNLFTDKKAGLSKLNQWGTLDALQELGHVLFPETTLSDDVHRVLSFLLANRKTHANSLAAFESWLADPQIADYLNVNVHQDIRWFSKEKFDQWLDYGFIAGTLHDLNTPGKSFNIFAENLIKRGLMLEQLRKAEQESNYEVDKMVAALTDLSDKSRNRKQAA